MRQTSINRYVNQLVDYQYRLNFRVSHVGSILINWNSVFQFFKFQNIIALIRYFNEVSLLKSRHLVVMKVKVLTRNPDVYLRETKRDIHKGNPYLYKLIILFSQQPFI